MTKPVSSNDYSIQFNTTFILELKENGVKLVVSNFLRGNVRRYIFNYATTVAKNKPLKLKPMPGGPRI